MYKTFVPLKPGVGDPSWVKPAHFWLGCFCPKMYKAFYYSLAGVGDPSWVKSAHSNGVSVLEGIRHFYSRLSVQTQSHFLSLHKFGQNLRFAGSPALGEVRVSRVAHISARNEDRVLPRDVFIALPFTHKGITATAGAEDLPQLWKRPGTLIFKDRVRFLVQQSSGRGAVSKSRWSTRAPRP